MTDEEAIEAGHKAIVNSGTIKLFGQDTGNSMSRLTQMAEVGSNTIHVEYDDDKILKWKVGDWISFASTSYDFEQGEKHQIKELKGNGEILLETSIIF